MIFKAPHLLTKLEIWAPKYSKKYEALGERVALLAKYKTDAATPWIIVEFTQAKHLLGLRYCIKRTDAQSYPIVKNGSKKTAIDCYEVPMSKLESWDKVSDIKGKIEELQW